MAEGATMMADDQMPPYGSAANFIDQSRSLEMALR